MRYELTISEAARQQLRELPDDLRRNVGFRLRQLQEDLNGDVKKLKGFRNHYRLRVGTYRILFRLVESTVEVYAVKLRKEAY